MNLTKVISWCHAIHNATSLPGGRKQIGYCVHHAGVTPPECQGFATDEFLRPGAVGRRSVWGRAMKSRSSVTPIRQAPKLPAALADRELQHLETVVRHLCNTDALDTGTSLGLSYWLNRLADIERRFYLVPPQLRRLTALRNMLMEESRLTTNFTSARI
jgi:hypothetical protein